MVVAGRCLEGRRGGEGSGDGGGGVVIMNVCGGGAVGWGRER